MFKTVYKHSHLIASAVIASVLMSTAGAMVLSEHQIAVLPQPTLVSMTPVVQAMPAPAKAPLIGRFTVTPDAMQFSPAR